MLVLLILIYCLIYSRYVEFIYYSRNVINWFLLYVSNGWIGDVD